MTIDKASIFLIKILNQNQGIDSQYLHLRSGNIVYRKGIRGEYYIIDFSDDGGRTWELEIVKLDKDDDSIVSQIDKGVDGYRHMIRGRNYCIDTELTEIGFNGAEGVDWVNVYEIAHITGDNITITADEGYLTASGIIEIR
ncbi:MAG: hypothetical protein RBT61_00470 [Candidatus Kapabacteria bacterium]|jgi:hypothetical protein|nr:hypothetical protein [Candidatus Kapabacteria bacterium]